MCPLGTQAATEDIEAAFRTHPLWPPHKRFAIIYFNGKFYMDQCAPFGLTTSGGIQGMSADALVDIWKHYGIGQVLKWVDDFIIFRAPSGSDANGFVYHYDLDHVKGSVAALGIPWNLKKEKDFASLVVYIGFLWDLKEKRVSLTEKKRLKSLAKVNSFITAFSGMRAPLDTTQSLLGTLAHIAFVYQRGRPFLPALQHFISTFISPHECRFPKPRMMSDLAWWRDTLIAPCIYRQLQPAEEAIDINMWVDASTSFGIGMIFQKRWAAWKLANGWNARGSGHDIGWAECVAMELAVLAVAEAGMRDCRILLRGDNMGVIGAIRSRRGRNIQQNESIRRIDNIADMLNIDLDPIYVDTKINLADKPSHGEVSSIGDRLDFIIALPGELNRFLCRV